MDRKTNQVGDQEDIIDDNLFSALKTIYYIKNEANKGIICTNSGNIIKKITALGIIKKLCLKYLFTFEGYLKSIKDNHIAKAKIPLILSSELVLFPTERFRNYPNIWINYKAIHYYEVTLKGTKIVFDNNNILFLNRKIGFSNIQKIISKIINYKKGL